MSTRAQIGFEGEKVYIYRHSDGYPERPGMLPDLIEFRDRFFKGRGSDGPYFLARLVQDMTNRADAHSEEWAEKMGYRASPSFLGFGIDHVLHGDIRWFYWIRKDGTIEVREPASDRPTPTSCTLVASIPIGMTYEDAIKLVEG